MAGKQKPRSDEKTNKQTKNTEWLIVRHPYTDLYFLFVPEFKVFVEFLWNTLFLSIENERPLLRRWISWALLHRFWPKCKTQEAKKLGVTHKKLNYFTFLEFQFAFSKYSSRKINSLNVPYDYYSVMHYGSKAFSKNHKPTIRSLKQDITEFGNTHISSLDAKQANLLYNCPGKNYSTPCVR